MNTLFEAIQLVPRHRNSADADDDWRWALRSMANRPILRLIGDQPLVVVQRDSDGDEGVLKARVSFLSSTDGDRQRLARARTSTWSNPFSPSTTCPSAGR